MIHFNFEQINNIVEEYIRNKEGELNLVLRFVLFHKYSETISCICAILPNVQIHLIDFMTNIFQASVGQTFVFWQMPWSK